VHWTQNFKDYDPKDVADSTRRVLVYMRCGLSDRELMLVHEYIQRALVYINLLGEVFAYYSLHVRDIAKRRRNGSDGSMTRARRHLDPILVLRRLAIETVDMARHRSRRKGILRTSVACGLR
jgi:hypothetical protein